MKSLIGKAPRTTRRQFMQGSLAAAAGLTIALHIPARQRAYAATATGVFAPNAFVRIAPDNTVTIVSKHHEMGQGITTGLATILADELDADWSQMRVEFAPADATLYANLAFGTIQGTGGSTGIANSWDQLREAGATARAMLVTAAADDWKVPVGEIKVSKGVVSHAKSGKSATFGALAEKAATVTPPANVKPKDPKQYTLIGKHGARIDSAAKSTGTQLYTSDVRLPGQLTALIARPPVFGATVKSYDAKAARNVKGVVKVVETKAGVAVIAKDTWSAMKGREALQVTWNEAKAEKRGSADLLAEYKKLAETPGVTVRNDGDAEAAIKGASKVLEADFEFPYLAHAAMEPMNCVVQLSGGRCETWSGHQIQTLDLQNIAQALGLPQDKIKLNTLMSGGSFGRRAVGNGDYVVDAVLVAKAAGLAAPINVMRTREDDMRGGYYRPLYFHRLRAGLDAAGNLVGWHHRIVGQSVLSGTAFEGPTPSPNPDASMIEGASTLPYAIANIRVDAHKTKVGVPVLWWRSVGHTHTAYSTEVFLDELAAAAGKDPFEFRRALLANHPREKAVLELAAQKAGWGRRLSAGRGRGIAVHKSFDSYVAQVAEVTVNGEGRIKVDRVVCAVDCGIAVNPDVIRAQIEGGIGYGLSAALYDEITLEQGAVQQSNFSDYEVLRIDAMPAVEVHIVPSTEKPTGVGEPGTPPIAPAIANAVAAATGKRIRALPFRRANLA